MAYAFYLQKNRDSLLSSYSFREGEPTDFTVPSADIFNQPAHLYLQASRGWISFACLAPGNESPNILLHVFLDGTEARSPQKSPYGGVQCYGEASVELLSSFIDYAESSLRGRNVKRITITQPPLAYSTNLNHVAKAMLQQGYQLGEKLSVVIPITDQPFEAGLHISEKKRLRKSRDAGFQFQIEQANQLDEVYEFLVDARKRKGFSLSMDKESIRKTMREFPDAFILTTVRDKNSVAAANISIRVNHRVLYNFYHDHAAGYDTWSPVVLLNEGLYAYAAANHISFLDLGTSQQGDALNTSLFDFKLKLGGKPSRKQTFIKSIG